MRLGVIGVRWCSASNVELSKVLHHRRAMALLLPAETTMSPVNALLLAHRQSLGRVTTVGSDVSTRQLINLLLSTLLSTRIWNVPNEPLERAMVGLKAVSTALIGCAGRAHDGVGSPRLSVDVHVT